jgi:hypothetical protein
MLYGYCPCVIDFIVPDYWIFNCPKILNNEKCVKCVVSYSNNWDFACFDQDFG